MDEWKERDWLEAQLRVRDVHSKHATEFRKIGTDHVKLVLTNLHLINAGGLVAIPALASFTEQAGRPVAERLVAFGPSAILFVLGLVAATLAALLSYYNSIHKADEIEAVAERQIARLAQSLPGTTEHYKEQARKDADIFDREVARLNAKSAKNYNLAHLIGWASLAMFIAGCLLLTLSVREVRQLWSGSDLRRDAVPAWRWTGMDTAEAAPGGYAPLLDSIGRIAALVGQRNPRFQAAAAFTKHRLQDHPLEAGSPPPFVVQT